MLFWNLLCCRCSGSTGPGAKDEAIDLARARQPPCQIPAMRCGFF